MRWRKRQEKQREFEETALKHFDSLYNAAVRMTGSAWEAEDLIQEALLRAYTSFRQFEQGTNCKAWLFKIMMNTFINKYRKEKRESEVLLSETIEDCYIFGRFEEDIPNFGEVMAGEFLEKLVSDDVKRAIDDLPVEFRTVVIMSDLESLTYQEIADILGSSLGTVKSRLYRGRRLLQKSLWDYAVERGIGKGKNHDL